MPKYLFLARYTLDGAKGLAREGGSSRRSAIAKMTEAAGGKLESFYFAFGEEDAYVVLEYPDNQTAAAVALAINQSGGATVKIVPLLAPEDVDQAVKKLGEAGDKNVSYRAPGR